MIRTEGAAGFIDLSLETSQTYTGFYVNMKTLVKLRLLGLPRAHLTAASPLEKGIDRLLND
jgi:hypothetical protein